MTENQEESELPEGWVWTTIGAVSDNVAKTQPKAQPENEFTYVDISSIDSKHNRIAEPKLYLGKDAPSRARQLIRQGDTLLSTVRVYLRNNALVTEKFDGDVASTGFCVIRPVEADSKYVHYFTISDGFVSSLSEHQRGVSYPAVRDGDVFGEPMPLPPLPEQRRIVDKIEELFSDLDAGIKALETVRRQFDRYRQSVLKAAVNGDLTAAWREQHGGAEPVEALLGRILDERRARWEADYVKKYEAKGKKPPKGWQDRYKEPEPPDTIDLPDLPEGWAWTSLDHLIISGPQNGLYLPKSLYGDGTPILRIDDYQDENSKDSDELQRVGAKEKDVQKYGLRVGDLVINRVNSPSHLGKCLLVAARNVPALFESNMMRLRLAEAVNSHFVTRYLKSVSGRHRLTEGAKWAVNQASINQGDVISTAVPLPPLAEQEAIIEEVERRLSVVDAVSAETNRQLARADRLRRAILKHAFEGKLVPQHSDDNPTEEARDSIQNENAKPAAQTAQSGTQAVLDLR